MDLVIIGDKEQLEIAIKHPKVEGKNIEIFENQFKSTVMTFHGAAKALQEIKADVLKIRE